MRTHSHRVLFFITAAVTGPRLTVDQFLHKVPKSVVKHGKVIDIRDSVGAVLSGGVNSPSDVTVIETDAVKAMKERWCFVAKKAVILLESCFTYTYVHDCTCICRYKFYLS